MRRDVAKGCIMDRKESGVMRFFVDERVGCIAVIDRDIYDPDRPGLSADDKGVVRFWRGRHVSGWKKAVGLVPEHVVWEVPGSCRRAASRMAEKLNRRARRALA
jgi:hypothetical protein